MSVQTYEGIVEQGRIKLVEGARLPEGAKVYVVVPEAQVEGKVRLISPRLRYPEQAADFALEVSEDKPRADV